ncbi:MAG: hypothetical protein KAX16_05655, partial [Actinomycetia bacterium]|nr:hypothetical protein [Actinomycetes bacterium]
MKRKWQIIIGVIAIVIIVGVVAGVFLSGSPEPEPKPQKKAQKKKPKPPEPQLSLCGDDPAGNATRPLAIMVENLSSIRPQA